MTSTLKKAVAFVKRSMKKGVSLDQSLCDAGMFYHLSYDCENSEIEQLSDHFKK